MSGLSRGRGRPATFDREHALEVATRLFWRHGYEGTSVAMLTEALNVTPPTLYSAFGSKERLYRASLAHYLEPADEEPRTAVESDTPVYDLVAGFLRITASRFASDATPRGCMVASGALRGGSDSRAAVEATKDVRQHALDRFVALLDTAVIDGELPETTDREALARFYTAVIQGLSVQAIDGAGETALQSIVDLSLATWPVERARRDDGRSD